MCSATLRRRPPLSPSNWAYATYWREAYEAQVDRVRVSTQLVEAATGRILWSGKFEAARAETLELQDDIARGIIIELEPALTRAEVAVIRRQRSNNVDAWGCYHQAIDAMAGHGWNEQAITEALNFLRRAVEIDRNFAL